MRKEVAQWLDREKLLAFWKRWRYAVFAGALGILLLLLPHRSTAGAGTAPEVTEQTDAFDVRELEKRMESVLSQVRGAGEVEVVLTVKNTSRQILAQDQENSERSNSITTVTVARGNGAQETVPIQQISPQFQGALVVCDGGGDSAVRLALTQAVSSLTGLGSDRITVCRRK